jgi:hypothetical protein
MCLSHLIYTVRPCLIHTSHFYELDTMHCVNQMGKTHSKPLAARHGRGTAWARHAMCESALTTHTHNPDPVSKKTVYNTFICVQQF